MLFFGSKVYAQEEPIDTTVIITDTVKPKVKKIDNSGRHLSFGFDVYHPVYNHLVTNQEGYEIAMDYYLKHDIYLAAEGGWGGSNVDYTDLKYKTYNNFLRFGVNRSLLLRRDSADWDNMFIGARLGGADVKRGAATYTVIDSLWGNGTGLQPGRDFLAYWLELTMSVRVQLIKGLSAGWNVRGKFLLNGHSFQDLAPLYVAGYGRGDKNAVFDFNFYLCYGVGWKRKSQRHVANININEMATKTDSLNNTISLPNKTDTLNKNIEPENKIKIK